MTSFLGFLTVVVAWFVCANAVGNLIEDPVADFLGTTLRNANDNLLMVSGALSASGENFIFLSLTSQVNGRAGNIWTVYIPANGYYARQTQPITFRTDAFYVGASGVTDGNAVLAYFPANAEHGSLIAYEFDGIHIKENGLGLIEPLGKDKELYSGLFKTLHSKELSIIQSVDLSKLSIPRPMPSRTWRALSDGDDFSISTNSEMQRNTSGVSHVNITDSPAFSSPKSDSERVRDLLLLTGFGVTVMAIVVWRLQRS